MNKKNMQQGCTINEVGFVCTDLITLVNKSYINTKIKTIQKNIDRGKCEAIKMSLKRSQKYKSTRNATLNRSTRQRYNVILQRLMFN